MKADELLIKGRILLQKDNPFFAYLTMRLKFKEMKEVGTCGVNANFDMAYNPEWIESLTIEQIKTLMTHEIMHVILQHLNRGKEQNAEHDLFNISADVVINNILTNNGFEFRGELNKGIIPHDNYVNLQGVEISDIDKKTAEEVYYILKEQKQELQQKIKELMQGFDKHMESESKEGNSLSKEDMEKEIKGIIADAQAYSQIKGKLPKGMGRYIDELLNPKLNWREILARNITKEIISDYSYNMPSRRSHVVGVYMPKLMKENINLAVMVDTSGSIGKTELTEFLSEVVGITSAFNNIKLHVLFWDTELKGQYVLNNNNLSEILAFDIKGGGGTDFKGIYDYLNEEIPNTKLLVILTDGYATFSDTEDVKTIFALNKNSIPIADLPYGEGFKLE